MSEWGPWIEHDGKGCPVPVGTYLHLVSKCGFHQHGYVKRLKPGCGYFFWDWVIAKWGHDKHCIVRYRIRKPRGLQILEERLAEIDSPIQEVTA